MRGYVEVYKGNGDKRELIHSDHNLVVDGMREQICNMLSFYPTPSSLSASASLDTSSLGMLSSPPPPCQFRPQANLGN